MVLSKLDLALVAVIAGGMLWIEHGHRIGIETPAAAETAAPAASVCPDNDSVPFSPDCIAFIDGGVGNVRSRAATAGNALAAPPAARGRAELSAPACPASNENTPYSANCIRYLTGWYWRANPNDAAPR
jgi:hypothetical protein